MSWCTPLIEQLGFGGLAGVIVGYATKKAAKFLAVVLGLLFILLQFLAYKHIITLHWDAIGEAANEALQSELPRTAFDKFMAILTHNLPFGGSFVVGFWIGFKRG